jgi:glycosyltransferase involved in cell wall biosynthesis
VIKVAISAHFWGQGTTGSGQYLHRLVDMLRERHPDIRITLLFQADAVQRAPLPTDIPYHILPTPFDTRNRQLAKVWFEQVAVPQAVTSIGVDLLHVPYFAPPLRSTVPVVATIHDLIPMVLPAYRGSALVRGYTALAARASQRIKMILADSEASRQDILRLLQVPGERVQTVYLAADADYKPQPLAEIARVRQKYDLPEQFVLYLGGFDVRKNVPLLLEATAQSQADWKLVIAGKLPTTDSDFFPHPRRIVQALGIQERVQFTGWIEEGDKPALLAAASLFCFPSAYEGFGLPILEAMACGTATVTTNVSSLPELAGDGAVLVPPNDVAALHERLDALMANETSRVNLAERALQQAARFSWERCADETVLAYRQSKG